jgi:hypothetical protein
MDWSKELNDEEKEQSKWVYESIDNESCSIDSDDDVFTPASADEMRFAFAQFNLCNSHRSDKWKMLNKSSWASHAYVDALHGVLANCGYDQKNLDERHTIVEAFQTISYQLNFDMDRDNPGQCDWCGKVNGRQNFCYAIFLNDDPCFHFGAQCYALVKSIYLFFHTLYAEIRRLCDGDWSDVEYMAVHDHVHTLMKDVLEAHEKKTQLMQNTY